MPVQIAASDSDRALPKPITGARACTTCDGSGVVEDLTGCHHGGQNCPCGRAVECPRCEGSLVEPCDHCGEPSVDRYLSDDLCAECLPTEEHRFDACSICDRPIDIRESALPLCSRCQGTARAAGQQAADAQRYPDPERERVA